MQSTWRCIADHDRNTGFTVQHRQVGSGSATESEEFVRTRRPSPVREDPTPLRPTPPRDRATTRSPCPPIPPVPETGFEPASLPTAGFKPTVSTRFHHSGLYAATLSVHTPAWPTANAAPQRPTSLDTEVSASRHCTDSPLLRGLGSVKPDDSGYCLATRGWPDSCCGCRTLGHTGPAPPGPVTTSLRSQGR